MKKLMVLMAVAILLAAGGWIWIKSGNPDALRHIVLDQCLPNQLNNR